NKHRTLDVPRALCLLVERRGYAPPPAKKSPLAVSPAYQPAPAFEQVQYDGTFRRGDRDDERRGRFERRGNSAYFNNQRGYRQPRAGYREYNGFWFPPAAFIAGAIIGGALNDGPRYPERRPDRSSYRMSNDHVAWCTDRWRSYRVSDNSYQPTIGPRRVCTSP